jgi:hypothetical protein
MTSFLLLLACVCVEFVFTSVGDFIVQTAGLGALAGLRFTLFAGLRTAACYPSLALSISLLSLTCSSAVAQPYWTVELTDRGELQNRLMMDTGYVVQFPQSLLVSLSTGFIKVTSQALA